MILFTILLLAADFYYLKNIAGRRLVGLRWWNEANASTGDSHWVFESAPQPNEPGGKVVTPTDKRFFWIALYAQPAFWAALAIVAIVRFKFIWLTPVGTLEQTSLENYPKEARANTTRSHRSCPHRYKHPCFLEMRQVQPS